jgi:hypothetical protein
MLQFILVYATITSTSHNMNFAALKQANPMGFYSPTKPLWRASLEP